MVIVAQIDYSKIMNLGFESKDQALRIFKSHKSKPRETEDEYLKRIYPYMIETIINNLLKNENEEREKIKYNQSFNFNKITDNEYLLQRKYDILIKKYNYLVEEYNDLIDKYNNNQDINTNIQLKTKRTNQCYECSICNEIIQKKETVYDICHMFHIKCLTIWLTKNNNCPCCRKTLI
jgi:hypothetical protein